MTRSLRMTTLFRQGNDQPYLISTFFATVPSFAFTCKKYKPAATPDTFSVLFSAGKVFTTLPDKSASFRLWMCRLLYCNFKVFLAGLGKMEIASKILFLSGIEDGPESRLVMINPLSPTAKA